MSSAANTRTALHIAIIETSIAITIRAATATPSPFVSRPFPAAVAKPLQVRLGYRWTHVRRCWGRYRWRMRSSSRCRPIIEVRRDGHEATRAQQVGTVSEWDLSVGHEGHRGGIERGPKHWIKSRFF